MEQVSEMSEMTRFYGARVVVRAAQFSASGPFWDPHGRTITWDQAASLAAEGDYFVTQSGADNRLIKVWFTATLHMPGMSRSGEMRMCEEQGRFLPQFKTNDRSK